MNVPTNLLYSKSHEWVEFIDETTAKIGLTDYAQHEMGDIVFVNLPEVGDSVTTKKAFGDIESVKAVADLVSPFTGEVTAVNEDLLDAPEGINADCYSSWVIEISNITEKEDLLDAVAYEALCEATK